MSTTTKVIIWGRFPNVAMCTQMQGSMHVRKVWRYQRGNHNPYIGEAQIIQWSKEKGKKDLQWSTHHHTEK